VESKRPVEAFACFGFFADRTSREKIRPLLPPAATMQQADPRLLDNSAEAGAEAAAAQNRAEDERSRAHTRSDDGRARATPHPPRHPCFYPDESFQTFERDNGYFVFAVGAGPLPAFANAHRFFIAAASFAFAAGDMVRFFVAGAGVTAFAGASTLAPAFTLAHRFFCAARMLAIACGDNLRRLAFTGAGADFAMGAGAAA